MKATVLIDNVTKNDLLSEWGLAFYIEYDGHKILLDTGASGSFAVNAETLGCSLKDVEFGVLSHAHYDHSDGMDTFFEKNVSAPFYLSEDAMENCFAKKNNSLEYIGIREGMLKEHADRILFIDGVEELLPGVSIVPHRYEIFEDKGQSFSIKGLESNLYKRKKVGSMAAFRPDNFEHEQSLVFDTENGLVIFNSCCHGGVENIIDEVADFYNDKKIYALVGGFHLFESSDDKIKDVAKKIKDRGIKRVVTGHCTGENACRILENELGDGFETMYSGKVIKF